MLIRLSELRRIVREEWMSHVVGYPFGEMQPGAEPVERSITLDRDRGPRFVEPLGDRYDVFEDDDGIDPNESDDDIDIDMLTKTTLDPSARDAIHIQRW